jgi:hypothetical protein
LMLVFDHRSRESTNGWILSESREARTRSSFWSETNRILLNEKCQKSRYRSMPRRTGTLTFRFQRKMATISISSSEK